MENYIRQPSQKNVYSVGFHNNTYYDEKMYINKDIIKRKELMELYMENRFNNIFNYVLLSLLCVFFVPIIIDKLLLFFGFSLLNIINENGRRLAVSIVVSLLFIFLISGIISNVVTSYTGSITAFIISVVSFSIFFFCVLYLSQLISTQCHDNIYEVFSTVSVLCILLYFLNYLNIIPLKNFIWIGGITSFVILIIAIFGFFITLINKDWIKTKFNINDNKINSLITSFTFLFKISLSALLFFIMMYIISKGYNDLLLKYAISGDELDMTDVMITNQLFISVVYIIFEMVQLILHTYSDENQNNKRDS
jgi:hypothetical protein